MTLKKYFEKLGKLKKKLLMLNVIKYFENVICLKLKRKLSKNGSILKIILKISENLRENFIKLNRKFVESYKIFWKFRKT